MIRRERIMSQVARLISLNHKDLDWVLILEHSINGMISNFL